MYRPGSVRLDTRRLVNMSLLHLERKQNSRRRREKKKENEEERSAELGSTKETIGVPTTAVAPDWIGQRLRSKMYN